MREEKIGHTPGPWVLSKFTKPDGSEIETVEDVIACTTLSAQVSGGRVLYGVTTDGKEILTICYTGNGPRGLENARLISWAPEMLKVLKVAVGSCDGDLCMHDWHEDARRIVADNEPQLSPDLLK